jgi:hypothetical protein
MKFSILVTLFIFFISCKKENLDHAKVCVYGVSKLTQKRELIMCTYREIYLAGTNQVAANNIAESLKVNYVNVSILANYTKYESVKTTDCNCKP